MFEEIHHEGTLMAVIIRSTFQEPGIHFYDEPSLSLQVAFMRHPKGKVIQPHVHFPVDRNIQFTREALFIRKGGLRVDFYTDQKQYVESRELRTGDVILLVDGGHGFEATDDLEMIEVKQGPYVGDRDKERFAPAKLSST